MNEILRKDNETESSRKPFGVIYMMKNKTNGKIYFGQTTNPTGFKGRYGCHRDLHSIVNNVSNEHLKRAILKYGVDNFEICECFDIAYSQQELDDLEKMYIAIYNTSNPHYGYNKTSGGEHPTLTDETRKKLSEIRKGLLTGEKNPMYGKKHNEETKAIISQKLKQSNHNKKENNVMWGKDHTPEAKAKISATHQGKRLSEYQMELLKKQTGSKNPNHKGRVMGLSLYDTSVIVLASSKQAKLLGFDDSTICKCLKNRYGKKKNIYKGYKWTYLKQGERV